MKLPANEQELLALITRIKGTLISVATGGPRINEVKRALASSEVRLQWDPDHAPAGTPQHRRAIQLGLRGDILRRYAETEVIGIQNISELVAEQRDAARTDPDKLRVPAEKVYWPRREGVAEKVSLHRTEKL